MTAYKDLMAFQRQTEALSQVMGRLGWDQVPTSADAYWPVDVDVEEAPTVPRPLPPRPLPSAPIV